MIANKPIYSPIQIKFRIQNLKYKWLVNIINSFFKMKSMSSNKKKNNQSQIYRNKEEVSTPRMKKSYSVTQNHYLQLKLDTSGKKRQNLERNLYTKDKRIKDLETQVFDYQEIIVNYNSKIKQLKHEHQHERNKNQILQSECKQAVNLCKTMKDKCHEIIAKNQELQKRDSQWKQKLMNQSKKYKQLKEIRRREKRELKQIIMNLFPMLGSQPSSFFQSQDYKRLSKML